MTQQTKCCDECPGDDTCRHARVCMCGDAANHTPWVGHSPVSMHDYYCCEAEPDTNPFKPLEPAT